MIVTSGKTVGKIGLVLNIYEIPDISYAMLQKFWDDDLFCFGQTCTHSFSRTPIILPSSLINIYDKRKLYIGRFRKLESEICL